MNSPRSDWYCEVGLRLCLLCRVVAIAGTVLLLLAGSVRAQVEEPDALRQAVEKYLECVEEGEAPVTDEVIQGHELGLERIARLDSRVTFAKMFVAARRGQFREASKLYTTLPRDYRQSLLVLQTKIWASINTEDDIDAQREMIYLSHYAEKSGDAEKSRQAAEFVGTMYGYLAGPAGRPQKEFEEEVFCRIVPKYQPFFEAGREEATERFTAIEVKLNAAREEAKVAERERRDREIKKIVAQLADFEKQLQPMLASLKQAEADLASELKVDEDEIRLLTKQMLDLEEETATLSKRIKSLNKRIAEIREAAEKETDPTKKQILLNDAARFEDDVRRLETERSKQDTRRTEVLNQRRAAKANIDKKKSRLDPQRKAAGEQAAKLDTLRSEENELRTAPIRGLSPVAVALESQATALKTYVPEFWSTGKTRILQSFD